MNNKSKPAVESASFIALLPLLLFLITFIGAGLYFDYKGVDYPFYVINSPVAILPAIILAIILSKQRLNQAIETFVAGVGHSNIITMCLIYLLAGAFAAVAETTGGVKATVALGLNLIPAQFLLPGFFLIAAFIATAMGTSMGTIAAVAPVALGVANDAQIDVALMAGAVLSGALFGDNLSIISDTTIAATRTQGCEMKDKFKENLIFAIPSAIIALILFTFLSAGNSDIPTKEVDYLNVLPYISILVLAIAGLNVFIVLIAGIILAGLTGSFTQDYQIVTFANDIYSGFGKMQEIFLLSMFVGGLAALMRQQGGIAFILEKIRFLIHFFSKDKNQPSSKATELGISSIVALTNVCVANNTVSIVVSSEIAKELASENNVSPKRTASLLDIFACVVQGLIPYGAQALLIASSFKISPLDAVTHTWYCLILAIVSIAIILIRPKYKQPVV